MRIDCAFSTDKTTLQTKIKCYYIQPDSLERYFVKRHYYYLIQKRTNKKSRQDCIHRISHIIVSSCFFG